MFTYLHDLRDLVDTLDEIKFEDIPEVEDDTLSYEERTEIINTIIQLMYDYVSENPKNIHTPNFHEEMMDAVEDLIQETIQPTSMVGDVNVEDETLVELLDYAIDMFYIQVMPKRSYHIGYLTDNMKTYMFPCNEDKRTISTTLRHLKEAPQPEQRTMEWYTYRHNLITASNAYKAIETESTRNQLIFEKCKPITMDMVMPNLTGIPISNYPSLDIVKFAKSDDELEIVNSKVFLAVNINTPMHWGQRYEQVSTMYYEMINNVTVGEYGCIPHKDHNFIGASPDGIVENRESHLYGRMLEIKNIVNRDITGIPLKPYWVQMQIQMEVCDLDKCDFLETRFIEYADREAFDEDGTFLKTNYDNVHGSYLKGITMFFINKDNLPEYEHKPLEMNEMEYTNKWVPMITKKHKELGHYLVHTYYWKLKELSCVLVIRNKVWFELNIKNFNETWDTILKERKTGYAHRAPKKKVSPETLNGSRCLIDLDTDDETEPPTKEKTIPDIFDEMDDSGDTVKIELSAPEPIPPRPTSPPILAGSPNLIMHIRTESIDETHI
jgi:hypothetical protein